MGKTARLSLLLCVAAACSGTGNSGEMRGAGSAVGSHTSMPSGTGGQPPGDFGNTGNTAPQPGDLKPVDAGKPEPPKGGARVPMAIDDCGASNPAGLSDADMQKLTAGGAPGSLRMLNPYDGTVFPRGILPPTLMWDGDANTQYVYVHIKSRLFEYKGCLAPTAPGQLLLPANVWDLAGTQTEGNVDPYHVELSVMGGGTVTGPVEQTWTIAQATLKGSIYYNSYSSVVAGTGQGAVLRIPRGKPAEAFLGNDGCTACHSVSANGARMIALPLFAGFDGPASSYALTPDGMPYPPPITAALANAAFTGLSPDGTLYMTSAHGGDPLTGITGPRAGGPGAVGDLTAGMFETDSGAAVANSGLPQGAMMATFSPDAAQIAFTDLAIDNGHGLAVMSFDIGARTASNYKEVYRTGDQRFPGWPFFLPDGKALIFAIGDASDFSGLGAFIGVGAALGGGPASDVYIVDLMSGQPVMLARAMGFATAADAASGTTYLPFGAEELHQHYYPTVAPVAAGGYFWIFFDSIRHYGNQGLQRQIWGTAVDASADGTYTADGSHPAFYLTGQEAATGNHRAFAALDPCMMDGETCTSGTDCCGGFCYVPEVEDEFGTEPVGKCSSDTPMCSKINERCTTMADCCPPKAGDPPILCIAGFCAVVHGPD
jgi:hypothetical protein